MLKSKYFGTKEFYKYVLGLAVPIIFQNFITNFVSMLDNLMVGSLGTAEISGVSVANQLIFVFTLAAFGMVSGAGIFGAQYVGKKDMEGLRDTLRFKIIASFFFTFAFCWLFATCNEWLIGLYLKGDGDEALAADTVKYAKLYLDTMLIGLYPAAFSMSIASTLRENGETKVPMYASFAAVIFNAVFDYILIYGKFGAPRLGVFGGALATVIARFIELIILIVWVNKNKNKEIAAFAKGFFKGFRISKELISGILVKGTPLMLNETLWAAGVTRLAQCYSERSLTVVPAMSISSTYFNLFSVVFISMGTTIAIIIGQELGANNFEKAQEDAIKLIVFSLLLSFITTAIFIGCSFFIPLLYETTPEVRHMATVFMLIAASGMPGDSICNATYFTIRSGGKTMISFIMDSGFVWCVCVLLATILIKFTPLNVYLIYFIIQICNYVKGGFGLFLTKQGIWLNNIVED